MGALNMRILITNISYHCSIGAIKLLRRSQINNLFIIGSSSFKFGFCSGSLLVDKFYNVCSMDCPEEYIKQIVDICKENQVDFIISADEKEQLLFIEQREKFKNKTVLLDLETVHLFMDKYSANLAMLELGINVPLMYSKCAQDIYNNKIIVRERISCCSYGIKIFDNPKDEQIYKYDTDKYFIQEYIDGEEYTVDVLCDISGEPKYIIPRKRIAIRNGITYKCLIEKNDLLISICKKIYQNYYLPGFSNVQFIIKNNKAYFIELNPRLGGTTIASRLVTNNLMEEYINHFHCGKPMIDCKPIKWNTVVTRYYEEVAYCLEDK